MKKFLSRLMLGLIVAVSLTSCYSTSVLIGDAKENEPMTKVYTKHNSHLIAGLVNIGSDLKAQEIVGNYSGYKVNHQLSFIDQLLAGITFNIYTPSTTKIYVPTRLVSGNNYNSSTKNGTNNDAIRITHLVKNGETLQTIANTYQVTVKEIIQWNQLNSIDVTEGTSLVIFIK